MPYAVSFAEASEMLDPAAAQSTMRACLRHEFGSPEVLRLEEIETPRPGPQELRIRIHAASVNLGDWELLTGKPKWISVLAHLFARRSSHRIVPVSAEGKRRLAEARGLFAPKFKILGTDIAGTVESVGSEVTRFRPGDAVFGDCSVSGFGAFADYVCVPERAPLVAKPASMSFAEAAALPQAGFIALQAIRDKARVADGDRVLVNGAGGGAGSLAVQLAKLLGAEVTGVDGAHKHEMLRSIGCDHVIDYEREDFTKNGERYDAILDLAAYRSVFRVRRSLTPKGIYMLAGGGGKATAQAAFLGPLLSRFGNGRIHFLLADSREDDLRYFAARYEEGAIRPVVAAVYPLEKTGDALLAVGEKRSLGKVVIAPVDA